MTINPFEALRHALFSVFRNMGAAFSISWPWLIVLAVVFAAASVVVFQSGFGQIPDNPHAGMGSFFITALLAFIVYAVAFSSIAVNWHRYILFDEEPRGAQRLRVDRHVFSYLWRLFVAALAMIAILIIPMAILVLMKFAVGQRDIDWINATWAEVLTELAFQGVGSAFAGAIFFRSSLALPAAALGRYEIGIGESWRRTQGNFFPLLVIAAGSWLLQGVVQVIMLGAGMLAASFDSAVGLSALVAIGVLLTWYFAFFGITLFTSLYGYFVEQRTL